MSGELDQNGGSEVGSARRGPEGFVRRARFGERSWHVSALAGALLFFAVAAPENGIVAGLVASVFGVLYGVAVGALIRAFPVAPFAYPFVGLLAAPAVLGVLGRQIGDGGVAVLGAVFGLVLGLLEWGALAAREASSGPDAGD